MLDKDFYNHLQCVTDKKLLKNLYTSKPQQQLQYSKRGFSGIYVTKYPDYNVVFLAFLRLAIMSEIRIIKETLLTASPHCLNAG